MFVPLPSLAVGEGRDAPHRTSAQDEPALRRSGWLRGTALASAAASGYFSSEAAQLAMANLFSQRAKPSWEITLPPSTPRPSLFSHAAQCRCPRRQVPPP